MSKQELIDMYYKLVKEEFASDVAFQIVIKVENNYLINSVGSGDNISHMCLANLLTMYKYTEFKNIEDFADFINRLIYEAYEAGFFEHIQEIGGNKCES